jgi:hypothetical protein
MNTPSLIATLVLIGIALLLVLYPLWRQTRSDNTSQIDQSGQTLEEYQVRYQAHLAAIKDLMFDYEMGKVSQEDYDALLAKTKQEAAQVRRQLDALTEPSATQIDTALDTEIESLIAQYRNGNIPDSETLLQEVNAEIELIQSTQLDTQLACSACGNLLHPDDAFCSKCGQPVPAAEAGAEIEVNFCPQCGTPTQVDDAFCARCGKALR